MIPLLFILTGQSALFQAELLITESLFEDNKTDTVFRVCTIRVYLIKFILCHCISIIVNQYEKQLTRNVFGLSCCVTQSVFLSGKSDQAQKSPA